ncbi:MAG: ATP-dependent RNA helicase RhlE [Saprospiraceae bacterium]|jgi:ATP-dependent RNA helicase RhlE
MRFSQYPIADDIKKNLEMLDFKRPTDIQYKSIPSILRGEDVLAIAQTGTGKTAAFAIPVINIVEERKQKTRSKGIKCLVMVPTHELAQQVTGVFNQIGKNTGIKAYGLYGGVEQDPQIAKLDSGVDILIATPGRLFDLRSQGHLLLDWVEILILDEADHMLDLGFLKDIQDLMYHLPKKRQTLFFSATINSKIKKIAYSLVHKDAIRIQISPDNPVAKNINHSVAHVAMDDKRFFLERLINEHPDTKILVFVRTKVRAERVYSAMKRVNLETVTIHSDKDQNERNEAMTQFRSGAVKVLIATDITARGVDIPDVDYVVNYDLPDKAENYVHRIGRTGRGRNRGYAITFCSEEERPILLEIEIFLGHRIEEEQIDKSSYKETLDSSLEDKHDIKKLMLEIDEFEQRRKKKGKLKK